MSNEGDKVKGVLENLDLTWLLEAMAHDGNADDPYASGNELSCDQGPTFQTRAYSGRPKERIPVFLAKLGEMWQEYWPDWRFGQLICNLDRYHRATHNDWDFFYLEEDAFVEFLEEYAQQCGRR